MPDGRIALVHFLISFEAGELKARAISVLYKDESIISQTTPLALCGACVKSTEIISEKKYYQKIISPYAQFAFLVSQPTRAPSAR